MGRVLRSSGMAMTAIATVLLAGCGSDDTRVDRYASSGWPAAHADARNSSTSPVTGSRDLDFAWSRPLGGPVTAHSSVAANGNSFVTARTANGCTLYSFQMDSGRKKWCARLNDGATVSTPLVDTATNVYIGESGAMMSFTDTGQLRWRTLVVGTPLSSQFTSDGNLLFVTQLGQVNVLNPQTGAKVAASVDMIAPPSIDQMANAPLIPDDQGLNDCPTGASGCAVAAVPAVDAGNGRFYFTFRAPGAPDASVVAMSYTGGDNASISREWSTDLLADGSTSSPALSADGSTVYVTDNAGSLHAVDAETGENTWSYQLGYTAVGALSVSSDGLIIPAGGERGRLLAVRDAGDHAELAWERRELLPLGTSVQTAGDTGYAVVRAGEDEMNLVTFDTGSGETLDQDTVPNAHGFSAGVSVGPIGEVLAPSAIGELFVFK